MQRRYFDVCGSYLSSEFTEDKKTTVSSDRLERLPQNGSILTQLHHINESDANSSGPAAASDSAHDSAPLRDPPPAPAVDPPPAELDDDILDGVLSEDNILDTLVPD